MPVICHPPRIAPPTPRVFLYGNSQIQLMTAMWRVSKSECPQKDLSSRLLKGMSRRPDPLSKLSDSVYATPNENPRVKRRFQETFKPLYLERAAFSAI